MNEIEFVIRINVNECSQSSIKMNKNEFVCIYMNSYVVWIYMNSVSGSAAVVCSIAAVSGCAAVCGSVSMCARARCHTACVCLC